VIFSVALIFNDKLDRRTGFRSLSYMPIIQSGTQEARPFLRGGFEMSRTYMISGSGLSSWVNSLDMNGRPGAGPRMLIGRAGPRPFA
jgi:hypothetical protein